MRHAMRLYSSQAAFSDSADIRESSHLTKLNARHTATVTAKRNATAMRMHAMRFHLIAIKLQPRQ